MARKLNQATRNSIRQALDFYRKHDKRLTVVYITSILEYQWIHYWLSNDEDKYEMTDGHGSGGNFIERKISDNLYNTIVSNTDMFWKDPPDALATWVISLLENQNHPGFFIDTE